MKQLKFPQLEVPEVLDDRIAWYSRANILVEDYKFQPTTIPEINLAISGVIAFNETPAMTGTHLQEILLHQKNNPLVESPDKTVRAVVREMGAYFLDAFNRRDALRSVFDTLYDDVNPNLNILEVEGLDMLGLLSGIQYHASLEGISARNKDALKGRIRKTKSGRRLVTGYDKETNDEITIGMLVENLPDDIQSTGGFNSLVLRAGKSQKNRRYFWQNALMNSRSHLAGRPVADEILRKIN